MCLSSFLVLFKFASFFLCVCLLAQRHSAALKLHVAVLTLITFTHTHAGKGPAIVSLYKDVTQLCCLQLNGKLGIQVSQSRPGQGKTHRQRTQMACLGTAGSWDTWLHKFGYPLSFPHIPHIVKRGVCRQEHRKAAIMKQSRDGKQVHCLKQLTITTCFGCCVLKFLKQLPTCFGCYARNFLFGLPHTLDAMILTFSSKLQLALDAAL